MDFLLENAQWPIGLACVIAMGLMLWRPALGIAALAGLYPLLKWAPRMPVPGLNFETVMIGILVALVILRFGFRLPSLRVSGPAIAFIAVMFMAFLVAIPWARRLNLGTGEVPVWKVFTIFKSVVFTALLFFPAFWFTRERKDRQRLLVGISLAVFIASAAGLADAVLGITKHGAGSSRAAGLNADPNGLGMFLGAFMFAPLYLYMRGEGLSFAGRLFHVGTYTLAGLTVVATLSRGNWLAMVIAHGIFFLFVNRQLLVLGGVALVLSLTLAFPFVPAIVRDRVEGTSSAGRTVYQVEGSALNIEGSAATRVVFYRIGTNMFLTSPIWGRGTHFFNFHTPKFGARYGMLRYKDPHSLPIKMAAETGLIGLATLAWMGFGLFTIGMGLWRSRADERLLGVVFLAMGTHVVVASLTSDAFLYQHPVSGFYWILYGAMARAYVSGLETEETPTLAYERGPGAMPAGAYTRA